VAELSDHELDALAFVIFGRLQAVVPEGASPSVGVAGVRYQLDVLVNQPGRFEDNLVIASESIRSHAQGQIMRNLKEGWPRVVDGTPGVRDSGKDLPWPDVAVVSGTLRLWYGDARRPALELPPIPLDGLDAGAELSQSGPE
jgi:hypothetical protein